MRWLVWWCVGGLIACGKSAPMPEAQAEAGAAGEGAGGTAGTATQSGGSAGLAGGGGVAAGGSSSRAGSGGASAGAASGGRSGGSGEGNGAAGATSGQGATSGHGGANAQGGRSGEGGHGPIGAAGEGGATGYECAEYTACGCGCCGGVNPDPGPAKCYYPELGDDLDAIRSEDEAVATSPSCDNAGCSLGTRYRCCVATALNDEATYEGSQYIGGIDRVSVARESTVTGRCTRLSLSSPPATGRDQFRLVVPDGYALEAVQDYACEDENSAAADSRRYPIGGFGEIRWITAARCSLDLDVTLFFESESGGIDTVRFDTREVVITPGSPCDPAG